MTLDNINNIILYSAYTVSCDHEKNWEFSHLPSLSLQKDNILNPCERKKGVHSFKQSHLPMETFHFEAPVFLASSCSGQGDFDGCKNAAP